MGLAALGIGAGDEVILADTNWIASAAPITYLGARPVFVDILARHLVHGSPMPWRRSNHAAHQGDSRGALIRQPLRYGRTARDRHEQGHPGRRGRRGRNWLDMAWRTTRRNDGRIRGLLLPRLQNSHDRRRRCLRHERRRLVQRVVTLSNHGRNTARNAPVLARANRLQVPSVQPAGGNWLGSDRARRRAHSWKAACVSALRPSVPRCSPSQ